MAPRVVPLTSLVRRLFPELSDPDAAIRDGGVLVDGLPVTNPRSGIRRTSQVRLRESRPLRGHLKLDFAMDRFTLDPSGMICLDLGACTGGFTQALLERGAARVYAVDVGYGQLLGSLRQDSRVVNMERTNLGSLAGKLDDVALDIIVADVTYVPLRTAIGEVTRQLRLTPGTALLALVKPMFELGAGQLPDAEEREEALRLASDGLASVGWQILGRAESPIEGSGGAVEFFIHAIRTDETPAADAPPLFP
jgi:23S rRNA (cytidine1920-2'-O)/16S rRNA (cytidine1409-2'-O)-methyltransferase